MNKAKENWIRELERVDALRERRESRARENRSASTARPTNPDVPQFPIGWPVSVSMLMLLGGVLMTWPYGYYVILRWVVSGSAVIVAFSAPYPERGALFWLLLLTAVLFNPVIPVYLNRETWVVIDLGVWGLFLVAYSISTVRGRGR